MVKINCCALYHLTADSDILTHRQKGKTMFHYFDRKFVCERLRLSPRSSYRIFGASRRIRSDYMIDLLNRTRRGTQELLEYLPSDLRTPEEMAELLTESNITAKMLKAWTHRQKNPPPFFRINSHFILFRESAMLDWLDAQSRPRRYIFGELMYERKRETGTIHRRLY